MTTTAMTAEQGKEVARPLRVLVPLIRDDLSRANEAGMPFYQAAGAKLLEAKSQLKHGEFKPWLQRNFDFSYSSAVQYMNFADRDEKFRTLNFSSLNEFHRQSGSSNYRSVTSKKDWHEPVKQIMSRVDVETLRQGEMKRADERDAQHKLALQLIDIGYKALASKLHPDKGGSRDAMARLNQVRDRLKLHA
jgi:hypothetical protein